MMSCSPFQKWPIKEVTIVCDIYTRLQNLYMVKPSSKKLFLHFHICNFKVPFIFWFWGILYIFYIFPNTLQINNKIALAINHVRNHHY
nr:hypothetical protein Iba_chr07cCG5470 [Ipomoea batatas]